MKKATFLLLGVLIAASSANAQFFRDNNNWKKYKSEFSLQFGVSNFLGDLGGGDGVGRPFLYDLDAAQTNYAFSLAYRYFVSKNFSVRGNLSYAQVTGDDLESNFVYRRNRNLHFRSPIIEGAAMAEYHLLREALGFRYKFRGMRKGSGGNRLGIYTFAGIGMFYYNPQAQLSNNGVRVGKWYNLRELGTEGQGIKADTDFYSPVALTIPMGMGFKYTLSRTVSLGLEIAYRKTFTDYLDDVSTNYYDNDVIGATYGPEAAQLADPSLDLVPDFVDGTYEYSHTKAGFQRGNPDKKDAYFFTQFTISYRPLTRTSGPYRVARGRRSRPSF